VSMGNCYDGVGWWTEEQAMMTATALLRTAEGQDFSSEEYPRSCLGVISDATCIFVLVHGLC
jgi:hypothetical protein